MKSNKTISVIIPVLNEEKLIGKVLDQLAQTGSPKNIQEVICVDGGSQDKTVEVAEAHGAKVMQSQRGRAKQMNYGAKKAEGDILYFLHADTFTPKNFDEKILKAVNQGYDSGCFRMKFDTRNPFLRFFAYMSRVNHRLCRGGDQSLFVKKNVFKRTNGFNEAYLIYEDTEFITRLYQHTTFKILPDAVVTSARKYREKGWVKIQFHFGMIHLKNYLGAKPDELYRYYAKNILGY
ncbi:TIGR04283 family arsenosugar biosynthesis glycosyltransferase [Flagellimonas myxillae]|uniref:TIGR04283 family arsenosugar biosynthesis glycosyltransferase n=1 Tax=Flagellimonas myxillae TaxID=2942214 RepID=UPI00201EFBA7|nr:TIGR04283 family arsenosugar biosynthesis glycosyltransferase [Muricauda myxillae]MCL6267638.1 TIGR04283 family arsenosugar biosynthesis glycosyltransferase [Muricauda myxillae]